MPYPADISQVPDSVVLLYDNTLLVDTASWDVQNIPGTYKSLMFELSGRGDTAATSVIVNIRFNNDSGANYNTESVFGAGGSPGSGGAAGDTKSQIASISASTAPASYVGNCTVKILNYAATVLFKTYIADSYHSRALTVAGQVTERLGGIWLSTAAINRITILLSAGNFVIGSRLTIYGIY